MSRKPSGENRAPVPDRVTRHFVRWTGPREEVFNVLVGSHQHLSAKEIFSTVQSSTPDIGLATIYRTLEALDKAGLVRKVTTHTGEVRFEYKHGDQNDHHHHLVCTGCGKIVNYRDFEKEELELVRRCEALLSDKYGFLIRDHNIEYVGLCSDCRPGGTKSPIRRAPAESAGKRTNSGRNGRTSRKR